MLEAICGNKNVAKILIFLFVNEKCYGCQLQRSLKTSLTPLQKALNRLEKTGVIISDFEGKTKVYRFNPSYPLYHELEPILKKAYTILPSHEKKYYSVIKEETAHSRQNSKETLLNFWKKLKSVRALHFTAKTKSQDEHGWNGRGEGQVILQMKGDHQLSFHEKGVWKGKLGTETTFTNIFRWTLDMHAKVISLEHLRHGEGHPVFLFHLTPTSKDSLSSVDSHFCEDDTYFGQIYFDKNTLRLNWRVIGPKKNEEIDYYYS